MAYFLKILGGGARGGAMPEEHIARVYEEVGFPRRPRRIRVGDKLVLYAAGHQCVFGIVEVFSPIYEGAGNTPWNYRCPVRPRLVLDSYRGAPPLDALNDPARRDLRRSIPQQAFLELTEDEFQNAVAALRDAGAEARGWGSL